MSIAEIAPVANPQLRFRLRGDWHPLLVDGEGADALRAKFVRALGGTRDADAVARALLAEQWRGVIEGVQRADAQAVFVCTALQPDVPMPIMLSVFAQPDLRMSPAIGTEPDAVASVFAEVLETIAVEHRETVQRIDGRGFVATRLHRVEVGSQDAAGETITTRTLVADYWYTVPGTKQILLVNFLTPMGDIPNVMLSFFDAIVKASYFELPEPAAPGPEAGMSA